MSACIRHNGGKKESKFGTEEKGGMQRSRREHSVNWINRLNTGPVYSMPYKGWQPSHGYIHPKRGGRKELVNATQPAIWGLGGAGVLVSELSVHCGLALTKGVRTGNCRLLISKLYPKGASETLGLQFLLKSEIVESVSLFLAQLIRWLAPPQPRVILGLCPIMSTTLKQI